MRRAAIPDASAAAVAQWPGPGGHNGPCAAPSSHPSCADMGYHREPLMPPAAVRASNVELSWATPAHLVLIVAHQRAPQRSVVDCLAQRGLRCIWVDGLQAVVRVAGQVAPDAVVYDAQAEAVPLAAALAQLRQWFAGSLLVVDRSDDEIDEILALELGADGLLAHPVSPRRLR